MNSNPNDIYLLRMLSLAIVDNPRSTLKELAESVGISKATLHRSYRTRDNLEKILMEKSFEAIENIIKTAEVNYNNYQDGLRSLINAHYENQEFLRYICSFQLSVEDEYWLRYSKALDLFFLNGQKAGYFKIEYSVPALSEMFTSIIYGMIDAERRGRVASSYRVETIESLFLHGSLNK